MNGSICKLVVKSINLFILQLFFFYQSNYRILNNFLFLHAQNDNGYVHASLPHGEFIPILQLGPWICIITWEELQKSNIFLGAPPFQFHRFLELVWEMSQLLSKSACLLLLFSWDDLCPRLDICHHRHDIVENYQSGYCKGSTNKISNVGDTETLLSLRTTDRINQTFDVGRSTKLA
jgi:hypothetical protein